MSFTPASRKMPADSASCNPGERVRLNIGGETFQTSWATLKAIAGNRLSQLSKNDASFDEEAGEFFFDRNPRIFACVLEYHRTGQLHAPSSICVQGLLLELAFWKVSEERLSPCCWVRVREYHDLCSTLGAINEQYGNGYVGHKSPGAGKQTKDDQAWSSGIRQRIWSCLESPKSGKLGKMWLLLYSVMVILSITNVCFWSQESSSTFSSLMNTITLSITTNKTVTFYSQLATTNRILVHLEFITNVFFTLELFIRLSVCPSRKKLACTSMTWLNVICISLDWLKLGSFVYYLPSFIRYIIILDSLRIFRLLNIFRHCDVWCVLWMAIRESSWEICILAAFLSTGMLVFATMIFYAEFGSNDQFDDIPAGFWWAIITMTSVGYGDTYPITKQGYAVGGLCALAGVLATGLPIPIISNNFDNINRICRLRGLYIFRRNQIANQAGGSLPAEFQPGQDALAARCLGLEVPEKCKPDKHNHRGRSCPDTYHL